MAEEVWLTFDLPTLRSISEVLGISMFDGQSLLRTLILMTMQVFKVGEEQALAAEAPSLCGGDLR